MSPSVLRSTFFRSTFLRSTFSAMLFLSAALLLPACTQTPNQSADQTAAAANTKASHDGPPVVTTLKGAPVTLVKDGSNAVPIIVYQDATPMVLRAAEALAVYIEKITGAKPEIIVGQPQTIPASAIWVGYQPAVQTLFPEIDFDFKHAEEIVLAANNNHVVIAGRDRWDPEKLVVVGKRNTIDGKMMEYGTPNAVYTKAYEAGLDIE